MTPMIDVIFQLLIFFVVTLKQDDILSRLQAARPEARPTDEPRVTLLDVELRGQAFYWRGVPITPAQLDSRLERYARLNQEAGVVVRCTADSPHASLVRTLDLCHKHGLRNLSILSM
jgi:biopolymer transport protein ExbD